MSDFWKRNSFCFIFIKSPSSYSCGHWHMHILFPHVTHLTLFQFQDQHMTTGKVQKPGLSKTCQSSEQLQLNSFMTGSEPKPGLDFPSAETEHRDRANVSLNDPSSQTSELRSTGQRSYITLLYLSQCGTQVQVWLKPVLVHVKPTEFRENSSANRL